MSVSEESRFWKRAEPLIHTLSCRRLRVHPLLLIKTSLPVVSSQVCLKVVMQFGDQVPTQKMIYFNRRICTPIHESSE